MARAREYAFAEPFTRVTGLICQVRRGKATFFFGFFTPAFYPASHSDAKSALREVFLNQGLEPGPRRKLTGELRCVASLARDPANVVHAVLQFDAIIL